MKAQARPILYSFRRCPYAMRARLALAASGQQCELREVVLRNKPQALYQASPKATVPVLVLGDGQVLEQSLDIMLWALGRNDPQDWLAPDRQGPDAMLALVAECDGAFKHHLDRYKYPQRYAGEPGAGGRADAATSANAGIAASSDMDGSPVQAAAAHRAEAACWLMKLERMLEQDAFLFGHHAALADMAIAPFVRQFAHVDAGWFQAQPWPRLSAWLAAWMDSGLFGRVMKKYAPWTEGGDGVVFPETLPL